LYDELDLDGTRLLAGLDTCSNHNNTLEGNTTAAAAVVASRTKTVDSTVDQFYLSIKAQ
jgi:hypothetical protein